METKGTYREIPYESEPELWFLFWAFELHNKSIIKSIQRASSFNLTAGFENHYITKDKKGKEIEKREVILRPSIYTPEFLIEWNTDKSDMWVWTGNGKVVQPLIAQKSLSFNNLYSYVEVKPDFDRNNMTRLFKNNQKFMWDKHKIFINLVKMPSFFEETFTPAEYLKTRTGKDRKIKHTPITIEQYLDGFSRSS